MTFTFSKSGADMAERIEETTGATKQEEEARITADMEQELTDEQLVQLAEGASSWGANCNKAC
jgi:flavodoxin